MKKIEKIILISLLIFSLAICGCNSGDRQPDNNSSKISYEVIKISSEKFNKLMQGDLEKWYNDSLKNEGLHTYVKDGKRYILISAGEKPTGGFSIINPVLEVKEGKIEVKASLQKPGKDDIVIQAITYPHVLIVIKETEKELVFKGIEGNEGSSKETGARKESGTYIGQVDNNFIEIKISAVPLEKGYKVFQLSDKVKSEFEGYKLNSGEEVVFTYIDKGKGNPVITHIERIKNN